MLNFRSRLTQVVVCAVVAAVPLVAAEPDHPVITEVFFDAPGNADAPMGRNPDNVHQEFIEIYLPTAGALAGTLDKDALRLTFYEVEGDSSSTGTNLVNYRFDLPTFDVDPSNGLTPGALPRPGSGIVVLGWVDYAGALDPGHCAGNNAPCAVHAQDCIDLTECVADTPTALAGTAGSRVALIHGGITATDGSYLFIPINGAHFGGTTNFTPPVAENLIDIVGETSSGVIQNGSAAYLLVDRDAVGYVELCDDEHAGDCAAGSAPQLPNDGAGLRTSALLDGFAGNDDDLFDVDQQPYPAPTGDDIDLEESLPLGGAFSLLVAQVPQVDTTQPDPGVANGYSRRYVDVPKTTENADPGDDDPVEDALTAYRHVRTVGPFVPTPGRTPATTSAPELGVAASASNAFDILKQTTGRPGLLAANIGGDFPIDITASGGVSSDPAVATISAGPAYDNVSGQSYAFPAVAVSAGGAASDGQMATANIAVTAENSQPGDPAVLSPVRETTISVRILDPLTGRDQFDQPFEATVFVAVQGVPAGPAANELLGTDFGQFLVAEADNLAVGTLGQTELLTDPGTNLNDGLTMQAIIEEMPGINILNLPGPIGGDDLVETVASSAEVLSGSSSYDGNVSPGVGINGIDLNIADTLTFNGAFAPSEFVHFADAAGNVGDLRSGLSNATTSRSFELAIVDTHTRDDNSLETGATDDFGILLEVQDTELGSPMVDGQFIFLSMSGGREGADVDTLEVPPGNNVATIIYLDLDNLHTVLGIRSIERVVLIDGSGNGEIDVVEIYSLSPVSSNCVPACVDDGLFCNGTEICVGKTCQSTGDPCGGQGVCDEATDSCGCTLDGDCDDGLFCTGVETCVANMCQSSGPPCEAGAICFEETDLCLAAGACPGGSIAECADLDDDGVRDDNCIWWACVAQVCEATEVRFADMGGQFGSCAPDGAADGNDRFHALNCFADVDPDQPGPGSYPCEEAAPSAFNVDAGGQFGSCAPDGVCDGNDAFAALNAFGSVTSCSCPLDGGPHPEGAPVDAGAAAITLRGRRGVIRPGETVEVDAVIIGGVDDLRGYQLHVAAAGGRRGQLALIDMSIQPPAVTTASVRRVSRRRPPHVFDGQPYWSAFNVATAQLVAGLDGPGVGTAGTAYLATFVFRASPDAAGTFVVDLQHDTHDPAQRTYLFPTPAHGRIALTTRPAVVRIKAGD